MMLEAHETLDGIQYAISEIDDEIRSHIPELKRRKCTPRVMAVVDSLLDNRNDLLSIYKELEFDDYERMMTE
jgi:hypothetical protein